MPFWDSSWFWGIASIVASVIISAFFYSIGKKDKLSKKQTILTSFVLSSLASFVMYILALWINLEEDLSFCKDDVIFFLIGGFASLIIPIFLVCPLFLFWDYFLSRK